MSASEKRRAARILLLEPEETVARICLKALQNERLQVEWVSVLEEIDTQMEILKPQLILVGEDFEGCLGFEMCARLRGKTLAPILVLTTTDAVGFQVNCLQSGADDVILRPVQPELLLAKVQSQLRRAYRYSVPPQPARAQVPASGSPAGSKTETARTLGVNEAVANQAAILARSGPASGAGKSRVAITTGPNAGNSPVATPEGTQAPDLPAGPTPDFRSWPSCVACNYMGPRERFVGQDEHGRAVHACPACGVPTRLAGGPKAR